MSDSDIEPDVVELQAERVRAGDYLVDYNGTVERYERHPHNPQDGRIHYSQDDGLGFGSRSYWTPKRPNELVRVILRSK